MSFPSIQGGKYGFEKQTHDKKRATYGTTMALPDGRIFRYVENGGTAIGEGLLVASEAPVAHHDDDLVVSTTGAVGGTTIGITLEGTLAAKDLYAEGYIRPNLAATTPHEMYKIKSHPAIAASASGTFAIEANYFGWIQVTGLANVKMDGTAAMGQPVGASSNHAGQFLVVGADTTMSLGRMHGLTAVDNQFHSVMLANLF